MTASDDRFVRVIHGHELMRDKLYPAKINFVFLNFFKTSTIIGLRRGWFVLVFIDESGDAGFDVAKGSSPIFAIAMVVFPDVQAAGETSDLVLRIKQQLKIRSELKFATSRDAVRETFFSAIASANFGIRAMVVRKEEISSPRIRGNKDVFYRYMVERLIRSQAHALDFAKITIDGSGTRRIRRDLAKHLRRQCPAGTIRDVVFRDSTGDPLLQLADMCVGAIARAYRIDRQGGSRWINLIRPKIESLSEFH